MTDGVIDIKIAHGANKTGSGSVMAGLQLVLLKSLYLVPGIKRFV